MNDAPYCHRIQRKLKEAFAPVFLEITDDSARHVGHAGHNPAGETHFVITIVSHAFDEKRPVERHRAIYNALADEMKERVHALNLRAFTPDEYSHR